MSNPVCAFAHERISSYDMSRSETPFVIHLDGADEAPQRCVRGRVPANELSALLSLRLAFATCTEKSFDAPERGVGQPIARLRSSPFINHRDGIRDYLIDIDRGHIDRVAGHHG